MYDKYNTVCAFCGTWFCGKIKIDISNIDWNNKTGLFTVFARGICDGCGSAEGNKMHITKGLSEQPDKWWSEWKKIPFSIIEHAVSEMPIKKYYCRKYSNSKDN